MAANTGALPRPVDGLHVSEVGDEIVVVAPRSDQAHVLNGCTAQVWRAIYFGRELAATPAEPAAAMLELESLGLVELPVGMTRREALLRAGTVAVAGTVIT